MNKPLDMEIFLAGALTKASRLVFEPPHEFKFEIDTLLLADHKPDHSALRKILDFSTLAECHQLRALSP